MNAIADTAYLVALLRREDEHHAWAAAIAKQVSLPPLSCEAVLAETAFSLNSCAHVLAMLERGAIRVAFDCASHLEHLPALATHYADRRSDLADLCLIRMSELYPQHNVVTVDEADFRRYRRNKREAIPLLCPPEK
jgi:uncharacterized protein